MRKILLLCVGLAAGAFAAEKVYKSKGLQTGQPGMNVYTDKAPDAVEVLPRAYPGAPPRIPHSIDGLSVTRASNDCMNCHLEGLTVAEGHTATKIPRSHFTNPFKKTTTDGKMVTGTRYNCLQCHVPKAVGAASPVPQKT
jgi:cytochrome c-type protein NapB